MTDTAMEIAKRARELSTEKTALLRAAVIARHVPQGGDGLVDDLHNEAGLCRNEGADDIAKLLDQAAARIAQLEARLEVVPDWSQDADGIACRDDTIKLQNEQIKRLEAQREKLAVATARNNAVMCGKNPSAAEVAVIQQAFAERDGDMREALENAIAIIGHQMPMDTTALVAGERLVAREVWNAGMKALAAKGDSRG